MRLTPKQNMIIYAMQQGWFLITNCDSKIITCCSNDGQFEFSSTIFYNLKRKGLIDQDFGPHFDYHLTKKGKALLTKPVSLTHKK